MKCTDPELKTAIDNAKKRFKVGTDKGSSLPAFRAFVAEQCPAYAELSAEMQIRILVNSRKSAYKKLRKQPNGTVDHPIGCAHGEPTERQTWFERMSTSDLQVDKAYQRFIERDQPALRRTVESGRFDIKNVGALIVGKRGDGTYWVVDGQRRLFMLGLAGYLTVDCHVFASSGRAEEAKRFHEINKNRKGLQSWSLYHASLQGGAADVVAIDAVLSGYGLDVPHNGASKFPHIRAVVFLERAYKEGVLRSLCAVLSAFKNGAVDTRNAIVQSYYVGALTEFLIRADRAHKQELGAKVDLQRLVDTLCGNYRKLAQETPSSGMSGAGRYVYMATTLASYYNHRLGKAKKVHLLSTREMEG
jgi:hypothetical protein